MRVIDLTPGFEGTGANSLAAGASFDQPVTGPAKVIIATTIDHKVTVENLTTKQRAVVYGSPTYGQSTTMLKLPEGDYAIRVVNRGFAAADVYVTVVGPGD